MLWSRFFCWHPFPAVGRLNGMVSLFARFEELSHITSPFWSRDKVNPVIPLFFTNRTSQLADIVVKSSAASHIVTRLFFPDLRSSKWFPPLCYIDFSSRSSKALWLFYSLGRELSSLLICCWIKCYIVSIHESILLPIEYSVLGYSLLDNLIHYEKRCVIYQLTPR